MGDRRRQTKRRRIVLGAGVACLLLAGVGTWAWMARRTQTPGPLWDSTYQASSIGFFVNPDVSFTYAYTTFHNSGAAPASLSSVHLITPTAGLSIANAFLLPASQGRLVPVNAATFKQMPGLLPLEGASVSPGSSFLIVLEMRVPVAGAWSAHGIGLDYSAGGSSYQTNYPDLIHVCAPDVARGSCPSQPLPT